MTNASNDNAILLRAFAAVSDQVAATTVCNGIKRRLACYGKVALAKVPEQYWKIPEYWEIVLELWPAWPVHHVFDSILSELAAGWMTHRFAEGGSWAVWNWEHASEFFEPSVRWAHVECFHVADDDLKKVNKEF